MGGEFVCWVVESYRQRGVGDVDDFGVTMVVSA